MTKKQLEVMNLSLTCDMLVERGLNVKEVSTNDPLFMKEGRNVRNVRVVWNVEPSEYEKNLAEQLMFFIPTVSHEVVL